MQDSLNQPAFPIADPFAVKCPLTEKEALLLKQGMSLRDYFAAKTLQGLMANVSVNNWVNPYENLAEASYEMADAMLKARQE